MICIWNEPNEWITNASNLLAMKTCSCWKMVVSHSLSQDRSPPIINMHLICGASRTLHVVDHVSVTPLTDESRWTGEYNVQSFCQSYGFKEWDESFVNRLCQLFPYETQLWAWAVGPQVPHLFTAGLWSSRWGQHVAQCQDCFKLLIIFWGSISMSF